MRWIHDALAVELKRLNKFSHEGAVRVEVPLSDQPDHPRTADVVLQAADANQPQFLDVTVTDQAALRYATPTWLLRREKTSRGGEDRAVKERSTYFRSGRKTECH